MLQELVTKKRVLFLDHVDTWEEAIRFSCKPLEEDGTVGPGYAQEIIDCVHKYGPYIVLIPNFAMPHSMECSQNANGTAISFMKVEQPVSFDPGDPEKNARVFFTLAAVDTQQHLENMQRLFTMLTNEALLNELLEVKSPEDLLLLQEKYLNEEPTL